MQKIKENMRSIQIISLFADAVMLSYIFLYFYWMFLIENTETHFLTGLFARFNPMTWGTYLLGLTMLLHLIAFKNIIGRCLLVTFYGFAVVVSLVAIMGMADLRDMIIYVPNLVIIALAIVILYRQHNQEKNKLPNA